MGHDSFPVPLNLAVTIAQAGSWSDLENSPHCSAHSRCSCSWVSSVRVSYLLLSSFPGPQNHSHQRGSSTPSLYDVMAFSLTLGNLLLTGDDILHRIRGVIANRESLTAYLSVSLTTVAFYWSAKALRCGVDTYSILNLLQAWKRRYHGGVWSCICQLTFQPGSYF